MSYSCLGNLKWQGIDHNSSPMFGSLFDAIVVALTEKVLQH